ncbi:tripartite tricarboxylate transporter TctB family protein [Sulfuritalea sp.]|jgi:putative tricarboxylic transport membrane protein|uniref:tripartite tricarboxylate transporter TctB family protein n=1 Tax=Sulfuritalea sp. TaxID=2480090 RepID=UPI001AD16EEE|nr:tripartite tricarboxylate transporter TctB family protein [Sulfuritalea sp.]MBN8473895.1 tripartite tricarboxylate transporter TctB family protein [Sulfuritalea sp.]
MTYHREHLIHAIFALLVALAALVFSHSVVDDPQMVQSMARGLASPLTWPKLMLAGVSLCALGWAIEEGWKAYNVLPPELSKEEEALEFGDVGFEKDGDDIPLLPIILGLSLAMAYAFVIPWAGFTAATVVFLLLWLVVGGIRKPLQLFSVTLIGTVVLLYVFVKLALMPLDRGQGAFGEFTIALFRLLGIY